jgi:hypothetical protein
MEDGGWKIEDRDLQSSILYLLSSPLSPHQIDNFRHPARKMLVELTSFVATHLPSFWVRVDTDKQVFGLAKPERGRSGKEFVASNSLSRGRRETQVRVARKTG